MKEKQVIFHLDAQDSYSGLRNESVSPKLIKKEPWVAYLLPNPLTKKFKLFCYVV